MSTREASAPAAHGGRIVIVEDHVLFAEALLVVLEMEGHAVHRVLVTEQEIDAVVASVTALQPTLVVLDLDLGGGRDGVQVVPGLVQRRHPGAGGDVVHRPGPVGRGAARRCHRRGVEDDVAARGAAHRLADRRRASGCWPTGSATSSCRATIQAGVERGRLTRRFDRLSEREGHVLAQLVAGRQVRQIAEAGSVSEATVRTQVKSVLSKLGVGSQLAAVSMAHRAGWRAPGS